MAAEGAPGPLPFLDSLARSPRAEDRLLWLRVAVDNFLAGDRVNPATRADFEANFFECLAGVGEAGRLIVAKKLLSRGHAPPRVVTGFAALGGEAARFVLARSRDIPHDELLTAAEDRGRAAAVARRDDLDPELVAAIFRSEDPEALAALAENARAPLGARQILEIARRARIEIETSGDRRLADLLLARTPTRAEYAPLFLEATSAQRTSILLAVQRAALGRPRDAKPPAAPREAIERLERHALAGEAELFAAALAETVGCSVALAERIAGDRSGEPLAVTLAAIGAASDVSVRILTASDLREGVDYPRVGALARLQDALSPFAAGRVVDALVGDPQNHDRSGFTGAPTTSASERAAQPYAERRPRPAPPAPAREESLSPSARRRRRALAFLAGNQEAKS